MSALAVREELSFSELKALFEVSDGNLSAHARKLEEAEYLTCTKSFEARRPKSVYRLTAVGRDGLQPLPRPRRGGHQGDPPLSFFVLQL